MPYKEKMHRFQLQKGRKDWVNQDCVEVLSIWRPKTTTKQSTTGTTSKTTSTTTKETTKIQSKAKGFYR